MVRQRCDGLFLTIFDYFRLFSTISNYFGVFFSILNLLKHFRAPLLHGPSGAGFWSKGKYFAAVGFQCERIRVVRPPAHLLLLILGLKLME